MKRKWKWKKKKRKKKKATCHLQRIYPILMLLHYIRNVSYLLKNNSRPTTTVLDLFIWTLSFPCVLTSLWLLCDCNLLVFLFVFLTTFVRQQKNKPTTRQYATLSMRVCTNKKRSVYLNQNKIERNTRERGQLVGKFSKFHRWFCLYYLCLIFFLSSQVDFGISCFKPCFSVLSLLTPKSLTRLFFYRVNAPM